MVRQREGSKRTHIWMSRHESREHLAGDHAGLRWETCTPLLLHDSARRFTLSFSLFPPRRTQFNPKVKVARARVATYQCKVRAVMRATRCLCRRCRLRLWRPCAIHRSDLADPAIRRSRVPRLPRADDGRARAAISSRFSLASERELNVTRQRRTDRPLTADRDF